jgi:hypothetical protein
MSWSGGKQLSATIVRNYDRHLTSWGWAADVKQMWVK